MKLKSFSDLDAVVRGSFRRRMDDLSWWSLRWEGRSNLKEKLEGQELSWWSEPLIIRFRWLTFWYLFPLEPQLLGATPRSRRLTVDEGYGEWNQVWASRKHQNLNFSRFSGKILVESKLSHFAFSLAKPHSHGRESSQSLSDDCKSSQRNWLIAFA